MSDYLTQCARQQARTDVPDGHLGVYRWYLSASIDPLPPAAPAPRTGLFVLEANCPPVAYYRFLYDTVGENWLWGDRRRLSDAAIADLMAEPHRSVHVLFDAGVPAGFFELDAHAAEHINLAYFGLMPWAIGAGLGPFLLGRAMREAHRLGGSVLTVDTCTLDHPKALISYQRAGFSIVGGEDEIFEDPRLAGLIRPDAADHVPLARR